MQQRDRPVSSLRLIGARFFTCVLNSQCPVCTEGHIFQSFFKLKETCPVCESRYERDPGSFIGSFALNYFLTLAVVGVVGLVLVLRYGFFPWLAPLLIGLAWALVMILFRPIKALWLWILWAFGFVYPDTEKDKARARRRAGVLND